jgi:cold shock CspA family protein
VNGNIVSIVAAKGFFFIRVGKTDYFAHQDDLAKGVRVDMLQVGDTCSFDPVDSDKGPRASNVVIVDGAAGVDGNV